MVKDLVLYAAFTVTLLASNYYMYKYAYYIGRVDGIVDGPHNPSKKLPQFDKPAFR